MPFCRYNASASLQVILSLHIMLLVVGFNPLQCVKHLVNARKRKETLVSIMKVYPPPATLLPALALNVGIGRKSCAAEHNYRRFCADNPTNIQISYPTSRNPQHIFPIKHHFSKTRKHDFCFHFLRDVSNYFYTVLQCKFLLRRRENSNPLLKGNMHLAP